MHGLTGHSGHFCLVQQLMSQLRIHRCDVFAEKVGE